MSDPRDDFIQYQIFREVTGEGGDASHSGDPSGGGCTSGCALLAVVIAVLLLVVVLAAALR